MGNPKIEQARQMYHDGMRLIDIANALDAKPGTVRRWKSEGKWDDEQQANVKNERSANASERPEDVSERSEVERMERQEELIEAEVAQVMSNEELTDNRKLFCLYYVRCFNARKAYKKAYGASDIVAGVEGYRLLNIPSVREQIDTLKQNRLNRELLTEDDIVQKYIDIAFADMNDFVQINCGMVLAKGDIDGSLVTEISSTANGVKVKLADRMKALDWLAAHMDLLTDEQRARVAVLRKQAEGNTVNDADVGVVELALVLPDEEEVETDA